MIKCKSKRPPSKEIELTFYPEGYNGLDVFVEDFWVVHIKIKGKTGAAASFDVTARAYQKDIVLERAKNVLKAMKECIKKVKP